MENNSDWSLACHCSTLLLFQTNATISVDNEHNTTGPISDSQAFQLEAGGM